MLPRSTRQSFPYRLFILFLLGFSSGLPLLLTGGTLQAWMKDDGIDLATIGALSLVGLPYALKFLWAPVFDRYRPPFLGRRRGWAIIATAAVSASLFLLSQASPSENLRLLLLAAFLTAFSSASLDIVLDAYRREILSDAELGLGAAFFVNGYRAGMLLAGAGALFLADQIPWPAVYQWLSAVSALSSISLLLSPEPSAASLPRTLREAVVEPFLEFFRRPQAVLMLSFIVFYKIGETMATAMVTPFVLDLGFSKSEFAAIAKTFGMAATIGGGLLGGAVLLRVSLGRALWMFGIFQMFATLAFVWLAVSGRNPSIFAFAIALDYGAAGMGTSAYAAYMASICNKRFTATQYALLSSLMGVPRVLAAAPTGWIAQRLGWSTFFFLCSLAAIPGLYLLSRLFPLQIRSESRSRA